MPSDSRAHAGDRGHDHSILRDRLHWHRQVAISLESPSALPLESSRDLALLILFPSLLPMTSPPLPPSAPDFPSTSLQFLWWLFHGILGGFLLCCVVSRSVRLFATSWTVAHQAPLSLGFSRQEYCSGLPCPPPGDLSELGIEPVSLMSCIGRKILYISYYVGSPKHTCRYSYTYIKTLWYEKCNEYRDE